MSQYRSPVWPAATVQEDRPGQPLYLSPIPAGWPSPAEDYVETELDLHRLVVRNQASTFFLRATGDSMRDAGILSGDLLVVDRSVEANPGSIVIAALEGELTVKRLVCKKGRTWLAPENPAYSPIDITEHEDVHIWGVVTHALHSFKS